MRPIISEVVPGVQEILLRGWVGRAMGYDVRAYVIDGVLIDTGFPRARTALLAAATTLGVRGAVITHWHEDHAGNAPVLAARGVPLVMHPACETTLRVRPAIAFYRRAVWSRSPALNGAVIPFDPAPLRVIAAPGHSSDHLMVWDESRRIIASGDLFLGIKVRVAHVHERPRALVASLRAALALEPLLLLDAHRGVLDDAASRLRAKLAFLERTIDQIETLAAQRVDEQSIQNRLLGREGTIGWLSQGEYSKRAFVRAVLGEVRSETDHAAGGASKESPIDLPACSR